MLEAKGNEETPKPNEGITVLPVSDEESFTDNEKGANTVEDGGKNIIVGVMSHHHLFSFSLPSLRLVSQPLPRQRWGDKQVLPHVNWGDIFFDLFYVAAAYNLASIIKYKPTAMGLVYFLGCFGPVCQLWEDKTIYESRFSVVEDSIFHRLFEVVHLVFVATAVLHIRPYDKLSNPYDDDDMFAFCLGVTLGNLMTILRYIELLLWPSSTSTAKSQAKFTLITRIPPFCSFLAASVVSGLKFYSPKGQGGGRFLAASTASGDQVYHIPIILCLVGYFLHFLCTYALVAWSYTQPGNILRDKFVPINVDFIIHRYGEWIMLMLGESILSILIVDTSNVSKYYFSFYTAVLSVVLLQYFHFRSQPHHAEDHAMRRSRRAGVTWAILMNWYSAGLIIIGVSYKMLLIEFSKEHDKRRNLMMLWNSVDRSRELAGGSDGLSDQERKMNVAKFFSGSLAFTMLCLDCLMLSHRGFRDNFKRCLRQKSNSLKMKAAFLVLLRTLIFLSAAFIHTWTKDPGKLIFFGFIIIFLQVFVRFIGDIVFPPEGPSTNHHDGKHEHDVKHSDSQDETLDDIGKNMWPNRSFARAVRCDLHSSLGG